MGRVAMLLVLLCAVPAVVGQPVIHVDDSATAVPNGGNWVHAFRTLQDALAVAAAPGSGVTEIRVAQGVYRPDQGASQVSGDRTATFRLLNGVTLRGGFAGCCSTYDQRDPKVFRTILSGDLASDDAVGFQNRSDNSYHVVTAFANDSTAIVDGLEIVGGHANGTASNGDGGGLICSGAALTIRDCIFRDNFAIRDGGAVAFCGGPFVRTTVRDNHSGNHGGGLVGSNGPIINCRILSNEAQVGGGLFGCNGAIVNSLIVSNVASQGGGLNGGIGSLINSTIVGNIAGEGSAIRNYGGTIANSIVWGNLGGGPPLLGSAEPTHCDIEGWSAGGTGNIGSDPLFIDIDGADDELTTWDDNDYRPAANSPCLDAGENAYLPADTFDLDQDGNISEDLPIDLWRNQRVGGLRLDMGVIERGPSGPVRNVTRDLYYGSIQAAIDSAFDGEEVVVSPGTYYEYLQFGGRDITVRSESANNGVSAANTIIDAGGRFTVVTMSAGLLSGFTIRGGDGEEYELPGGLNLSGTAAATYNNITRCYRKGVIATGDSLLAYNDIHEVGYYGGQPAVTARDRARLVGNSITDNPTVGLVASDFAVLEGNTVSYNVPCTSPAGISASGRVTLRNNIVEGNEASEDRGGAMGLSGADYIATGNIIIGNGFDVISGGTSGVSGGGPGAFGNIVGNNSSWFSCCASGGLDPLTNWIHHNPTECEQDGYCVYDPDDAGFESGMTSSFHLKPSSSLRDAIKTFPADPGGFDLDGEVRIFGSGMDIGPDEFVDSDGDELADLWELEHGLDPLDPHGDQGGQGDLDADGITNSQECELETDPRGEVLFVDAETGNDSFDGKSAVVVSDTTGPKRTIQAAASAILGDTTILLAPGTYYGMGGAMPSRSPSALIGPSDASAGHAILVCSPGQTFSIGARVLSHVALQDCALDGGGYRLLQDIDAPGARFNAAFAGLGLFGSSGLDSVRIGATPTAGTITHSHIRLDGELAIVEGILQVASASLYGAGSVHVGETAALRFSNGLRNRDSVLRADVTGSGDILVERGHTLRLEGPANCAGDKCVVVDLSDETTGTCETGCGVVDRSNWGELTVDGTLLVRNATVRNANVNVTEVSFEGDTAVINNDIRLAEAATDRGGHFVVQGTSRIECNALQSEGDRYLDLDPDAHASDSARPIICHNKIWVTINPPELNAPSDQGKLLELRARDFDCGAQYVGSANLECRSGAFRVPPDSPGLTDDPSENWVLEKLELLPGARLSLTNREGFQFQADRTHPETVYVKELTLHPNSVLNTALQTLYYVKLVDEFGDPLLRDPNNPAVFSNGSRLVDIPVLGFSLRSIEFDDTTPSPHNEFDIRVRTRVRDSSDVQSPDCPTDLMTCKEGAVTLEPNSNTGAGGMMEMRTHALNRQPASSVAAKGTFARASGDEPITVAFQYAFHEDPGDDAKIIIHLSDDPDVSEGLRRVAHVRPPAPGLPGSIGSNQFATFYGTFRRHDLNFTRGAYIELELRGQGARVWIDRWDMQVPCNTACGDLNKRNELDNGDYLLHLAGYGQTLDAYDPQRSCLDSSTSADHSAGFDDLLAQDARSNGTGFGGCGASASTAGSATLPATPVTLPSTNALVIAGKTNVPGQQGDFLFTTDLTGACLGTRQTPASAPDADAGHRSNGRLVSDSSGNLYQLHATQGLVRLTDAQVVVGPKSFSSVAIENGQMAEVVVGAQSVVSGGSGSDSDGVPISDAAFDPNDGSVVYVVPVEVRPVDPADCPYRAAAKLQVVTNVSGVSEYALVQLYGSNPPEESECACDAGCSPVLDKYHPREIEVDSSGNVFVTSSLGLNGNDWLLMYDAASGTASESAVQLSRLDPPVLSPTALTLSSRDPSQLYLASGVNRDSTTRVYRYTIQRNGSRAMGLSPSGIIDIDNGAVLHGDRGFGHFAAITSMQEDSVDGALFVTGFASPKLEADGATVENQADPNGPAFAPDAPIFTTATLAVIRPGDTWSPSPPLTPAIRSSQLGCDSLALPLSATLVRRCASSPDLNDDGHVDRGDLTAAIACWAGPGGGPPSGSCLRADFDCSHATDLRDFAAYQRAFSKADGP